MSVCEDIVRRYVTQHEQDFHCHSLRDDELLLTTPYSYLDGDHIELLVSLRGENVRITDYGKALERLELAGVNVDAQTVRKAIGSVLRGFNVDLVEEELRAEGRAEDSARLMLQLVGALREIDGLQVLRQEARPPRFERRLVSHLRTINDDVRVHPLVRGSSGTSYRLTAALPRSVNRGPSADVLVQGVAGGRSETGIRAVNYAYRAFSDINGDRRADAKLVVLAEEDRGWRSEDVRLLMHVAYIAAWWDRERLDGFIRGVIPEDHRLFEFQASLSESEG